MITRKDVYPSPVYLPEGRGGVYNVQLRSRPYHPVAVSFYAINNSLISVSPNVLLFRPDNWNVSQELTVNALEDKVDRVSPYMSQFGMELSSSDANFHNLSVSDYRVTIEDNDNGRYRCILVIIPSTCVIDLARLWHWYSQTAFNDTGKQIMS